MRKRKQGLIAIFMLLALTVTAITGCSKGSKSTANSDSKTTPQVIKVAFNSGIKPIAYLDDKGNPTGFEVELFKKINELSPEYQFEYTGTTDDDLLLGLTTGQYDIGLKNSYYTEARAKTYIYPKKADGASLVGLIIRTDDAKTIKGFSDIATNHLKLNPLSPADANYADVVEYNTKNPNNQIKIEASDSLVYFTEGIGWLLENRIDALLVPQSHYNTNILGDQGSYHQYKDKLSWVTLYGKSTYPLFAQGNQKLADAYDQAYEKLDKDGTVAALLKQFLGEDTRTYVQK